jgi:hypothetical protein
MPRPCAVEVIEVWQCRFFDARDGKVTLAESIGALGEIYEASAARPHGLSRRSTAEEGHDSPSVAPKNAIAAACVASGNVARAAVNNGTGSNRGRHLVKSASRSRCRSSIPSVARRCP